MIITDGYVDVSDVPIICWKNVVTATNVNAESDPDFPASNVANPSTALKWKHEATDSPESATEYFRINTTQIQQINYVAIAGHNFNSRGIRVGLELASFNSPVGGGGSIIAPQIPVDDGPIIMLFSDPGVDSPFSDIEEIRIILVTGSAPAEMAVVYAGAITTMEQGIQADHAPLPLALTSEVLSGNSEAGQFLGRVVLNQHQESSATFSNLSKAWVRSDLRPFLDYAAESPFFYAWSPETYPNETAYAWLVNDPQPTFDIDGYGSVDLNMRGVST